MAVKEWFRRLQPVQLYIVLFFTVAYFAVELVASYVTHSLTLLVNAYHMLCNIVALAGCIASIKYQKENNRSHQSSLASLQNSTNSISEKSSLGHQNSPKKSKQLRPDKRMKSTFGWARIDILTMLVCCVLLVSFCFSLVLEATLELLHVSHHDAMHHPLPVMSIGALGILLNAFCYFLIGGYTFNQGAFLHFTKDGEIVLKKSTGGQVQTSEQTRRSPIAVPRSQGAREMLRDVLGCLLVMLVSGIVCADTQDGTWAKYADPIVAIVSSVSLFVLSYPYMKESGMILLQTIPNHINIASLQKELLEAFPDIISVHDLHVWQLNGEKVISTVHIIYADPTVCARINDQITGFFVEMGITHVTIQPEFCKMIAHGDTHTDCLIRCQSKFCETSTCCSRDELQETPKRSIVVRKCTNGGSSDSLNQPSSNVIVSEIDETSRNISDAGVAVKTQISVEEHRQTVDVDVDVVKSQTDEEEEQQDPER